MARSVLSTLICASACAAAHRSVKEAWVQDFGTLPPHLNATAPVNDRVAALLALMTVPEKVAQTLIPLYPLNANYTSIVTSLFNQTGLGVLYNPTQGPAVGGGSSCPPYDVLCNAEAQNALQASIIASSRLHIPISFVAETLHGAINMGAVFPMSSALGASWNTDLVRSIGSAIAREGRIGGLDRGYSPLLGVCTDARFGRTEENYGEDPALVAAMGVAFANGQHQGETGGPASYLPPDGLVTEAKHYAAYGYSGRDGMSADISDELLMDVYLRPWRDYVAAGGRGVMASHNSVQGMPNHMNARLLTGVLRDLFGMQDGFVATDDTDVELLPNYHIVDSVQDAAAAAITAGVDNNLANAPTSFQLYMASLVASGQVSTASLDRAAAATLRAKFAAGLFDNYTYINTSRLVELDAPATRALARTAAQESIVLLKNENGTLPLDFTTITRVAVLGPNAGCPGVPNNACAVAANMAGGYTNQGVYISTVLDAFTNASTTHGFTISYAPGAVIGVQNTSLIPAAVAAAAGADVAVVVLGHESIGYGQGDCAEGLDADDLDLDGSQGDLLFALLTQTSTPVVVVLVHGRPLTFGAGTSNRWLPYNGMLALPNLVAVLSAWRPGEEGGNALFDIISGAVNPSGRLAQGWPRHVGQIRQSTPWMQAWWENQADYAPARSIPRSPLFPFGYGLSYSTFAFTSISLSPQSVSNASLAASVTVNVTVMNSAGPAGRAVVQVYFNQTKVRLSRYVSMLLGFTKVDVPAAPASVTATIVVPLLNLAAWDTPSANYTVDATTYGIWASVNSGVAPTAAASAWLTVTAG